MSAVESKLTAPQECFNSLYGATYFPNTAETIGYNPGEPYDISSSPSESVRMLSSAAMEEGVWLLGGASGEESYSSVPNKLLPVGSIPEREESSGKLFNTATVYSPKGRVMSDSRGAR